MKTVSGFIVSGGLLFVSCISAQPARHPARDRATTDGAIAILNLDQQIAQSGEGSGTEEFLLLRSRFLADYDALDRASALAERRSSNSHELLDRARSRAAAHRFRDALADLTVAERDGGVRDQDVALRASILIAVGQADQVLSQLKADFDRHPGFASRAMLAGAYAALGNVRKADRLYSAALADLHTTLPFPYAWIYYARGLMWDEVGGDARRAEQMYIQALEYVPQFVSAKINLSELQIARGDTVGAIGRLSKVVRSSNEPEALALLGVLHLRAGNFKQGEEEISLAHERYESLLSRDLLAFCDPRCGVLPRAWTRPSASVDSRATEPSKSSNGQVRSVGHQSC
jgi:tetratricopeptide (TPR) repeat protein